MKARNSKGLSPTAPVFAGAGDPGCIGFPEEFHKASGIKRDDLPVNRGLPKEIFPQHLIRLAASPYENSEHCDIGLGLRADEGGETWH